ncbi:MAG: alpha/beta hydrolase [Clostridia bacterium]|nr:alpha/beta hydrolase [Clostridia bacterium]
MKRKRIMIAAVIIVAVLLVLYAGVSVFMASSIARPKTMTLEEEKNWEEEHGLWGDFDSYEKEDYTVAGKDGYILHCALIKTSVKTDKYVIISHGFRSNRYGCVKYVDVYADLGYNCIIYDVRGHGENKKTTVTLGNYESQDLKALIDDTYERFGEDITIGLHGESMGSSISLNVLKYEPKVDFVVADCGFSNLYDLISSGYKAMHVGFLTPSVNLTCRVLYKFNMKDTSAIDAVKNSEVPICFIHGANDDFIPPYNSEKLSSACAGHSIVHKVEGAGHAESVIVLGKEKYRDIVSEFLDIHSN